MKKIKSILVSARDARLSEDVYDSHVFQTYSRRKCDSS